MAKKTAKNYPCKLPPFVRTDCLSILEVQQQLGWSITAFNLPDAWRYTQGEGIVIAVLDTGVDLEHNDLKCNLLEGKNFVHLNQPPEDNNSHGTHITGILVASNNDYGMVGVAPKAKVRPVKVLDKHGNGNMASVAKGIRWAADQGCDFISMSLGSPLPVAEVRRAIQYAASKGSITFCAAGNFGKTPDVFYPAAYPETIAVGAVTEELRRANFSNTGKNLDFMAPGVDVYSTVPKNLYAKMSGTCIAEGSYIYTDSGPIKIENVKPGDCVFSYHQGKMIQSIVADVYDRGYNNLLEVRAGGRKIRVTPTHKILTVNYKKRELEWTEAQNIDYKKHKLLIPKLYNTKLEIYNIRVIRRQANGWSCLRKNKKDGKLIATEMGIDTSMFFLAKPNVVDLRESSRVYDLSVPGPDCFVTDGIITHNSMAQPFVCAVAALVKSYMVQHKRTDIILSKASDYVDLLKKYTIPVKNGNYDDPVFYEGFGIIDPRTFIESIK